MDWGEDFMQRNRLSQHALYHFTIQCG